ncbi:MAG: cache domain-containing protein [Bacteroidetes bacterium]|nr:cache domain-containing protein [Bacteroidota bacterium]
MMLSIRWRFIVALTVIIFLGAGIQFSDSNSLQAQVPKVTAGAVVGEDGILNEDSLKAFVTWAASEFEKLEDLDEGLAILQDLYTDGSDLHSGEIYLVIIGDGGLISFHGKSPQLNKQYVLDQVDGEGTEVFKEMLKATKEEAIKVEYCKYSDPANRSDCTKMTSFAIRYRSPINNHEFVMVAGYSQDLESLCRPITDIDFPEVSADQVVSRETLKMFVDGATKWLLDLRESRGITFTRQLGCQFRIKVEDGGHFRHGTVYLYVITEKGYVFFHATDPFRQGRTVLGNPDLRGDTTFVYKIIEAARSDSVFVDYYWDDPDNPNDDEEGTLRTTYGNIIKVPPGIFPGNPDLIVAGSFFPRVSTAVEDEISEIPSEFVLHGNYPNPFNPSTRIQFDLPERAQVTLQVSDVLGRRVMELPSQVFEAGVNHTIELNAVRLASGTYLYRMVAIGSESRYQKTGLMTLMK